MSYSYDYDIVKVKVQKRYRNMHSSVIKVSEHTPENTPFRCLKAWTATARSISSSKEFGS